MRLRHIQRWLVVPLWHQIRYKGKFGHPDRLGFVSLSAIGHRQAAQAPAPVPERQKVFHLADYTNFPFFMAEFRRKNANEQRRNDDLSE